MVKKAYAELDAAAAAWMAVRLREAALNDSSKSRPGNLLGPLIEEIRAAAGIVRGLDLRRQARARTQEGGLTLPSTWRDEGGASLASADGNELVGEALEGDGHRERAKEEAQDRRRR